MAKPKGSLHEDAKHLIYKITNLLNDKIYIGYTKQSIRTRWRQHRVAAKNFGKLGEKRALLRAISKYGEDAFTIEVIDEANNAFEAGEKERHWIKLLGAKGKQGYNMTDGGEGVKGWKPSEKHRATISLRHSGENNYFWGKSTSKSPHYGKPLSLSHKVALKQSNVKSVPVVINGVTYISKNEAAEILNVSRCSVDDLVIWEESAKRVCCDRIRIQGVFYFGLKDAARILETSAYKLKRSGNVEYVTDPWTFNEFLDYVRGLKKNKKAVVFQGDYYPSIKALAKQLGRDPDYVKRLLRDGLVELSEDRTYFPSHNAIQVAFCGELFPSKTKLMEYFGISNKEFNRLLNSGEIVEVVDETS